MTDFREKADIFNSSFANQRSLINSDSSMSSEILKKTDNSIYSVIFYRRHIKYNKSLGSNKAYVHDEISIAMMKMCGSSV